MSDDNYKWFSDRIRDKRMTQRAVAKLMDMDASTLSLLLHGKRRMRVDQAAELASILGASVAEVMRYGGADVREMHGASFSFLPMVGWIDEEHHVFADWNSQERQTQFYGSYPRGAVALQWRTAQTRSSIWDRWTAVVLPKERPDETMMAERLAVVWLKSGDLMIRRVARGYTPGRYTLLSFLGDTIHDAEIDAYAPVVTIQPL